MNELLTPWQLVSIAAGLFAFGVAMFALVMAMGAHALEQAELKNAELRARAMRRGNL